MYQFTVSILIGTPQKIRNLELAIVLNGTKLENVKQTKYLCLHIDCYLRWDVHVTKTLQKVQCKLLAIARLKPLTSKVLLLLY